MLTLMVLLVPRTTTATWHGYVPPAWVLADQEPPRSPGNRDAEEIAAEMGRHVVGKQELRAVHGLLRAGCPSSGPPLHRCVPRVGQLAQLLELRGGIEDSSSSLQWWFDSRIVALHASYEMNPHLSIVIYVKYTLVLLTLSQNHRIVEVGRDLWRSSGPSPSQAGPRRASHPMVSLR